MGTVLNFLETAAMNPTNVPEVTLLTGRSLDRRFCEVEEFLYFCMRRLALISLPMRRASVCGFLHEANVAVDFSSFFVITV